MDLFDIALLLATLLCSLVAGFLFAFAVVAMPGIGRLDDGAFLRAFQEMDRIIQNNHPLFMLVWVGSIVTMLAAVALGVGRLGGLERGLLISAVLVYLLGVQLPTVARNVPLNNRLQAQDIDALDQDARRAARTAFEPDWNRWNRLRTVLAVAASALLMMVLLRL